MCREILMHLLKMIHLCFVLFWILVRLEAGVIETGPRAWSILLGKTFFLTLCLSPLPSLFHLAYFKKMNAIFYNSCHWKRQALLAPISIGNKQTNQKVKEKLFKKLPKFTGLINGRIRTGNRGFVSCCVVCLFRILYWSCLFPPLSLSPSTTYLPET